MRRRDVLMLVVGTFVGAVLATMVLPPLLRRMTAAPREAKPVARGAERPGFEVRPDRRYDVYCTPLTRESAETITGVETTVYRDCQMLGITGREALASQSGGARGSLFSGSGFSSEYGRGADFFDNWLVLKRSDGRLCYVPTASVRFFEESAAAALAPPAREVTPTSP